MRLAKLILTAVVAVLASSAADACGHRRAARGGCGQAAPVQYVQAAPVQYTTQCQFSQPAPAFPQGQVVPATAVPAPRIGFTGERLRLPHLLPTCSGGSCGR